MKKQTLKIEKRKDIFLYSTNVSNLFINEMLPQAPGDYVKVYIFGLMYAQNGLDVDLETMGKYLDLSVNEIIKAYEFWARRGAVRLIPDEEDDEQFSIEFVRQIEGLYGKTPEVFQEEKEAQALESANEDAAEELTQEERITQLINDSIRQLFQEVEQASGRLVSSKDMDKIAECIKVYGITYDVYSYAIKYCKEIEKYSVDYISAVALRWNDDGCKTIGDVKEFLDKHSKKNKFFRDIFKEVGFNRLPSPADREMMSRWFDEWGFSLKEVIDACHMTAGQREPSLRYVNKVLENKLLERGGINTKRDARSNTPNDAPKERRAKVSAQVLKEYYEKIRLDGERRQQARIDEACGRIPEMRRVYSRIESLNREMLSLGLGGANSRDKRKALREERKGLEREKRQLLLDNGYNGDYLERRYKCELCKDTGTTDNGTVCVCSAARAEEAYKWMIEKNKH